MKLTFIGLGVMGYPMAGHLARCGHEVTVYNRTASKADAWCREYGGQLAATPEEAARDAEIAFVCVGNDDDVRDVVTGPEGALEGMASGSILIDQTTASATLAQELEEISESRGIGFLDAPLSGGQSGAEAGELTIMVGGREDVFGRAVPAMDAYAKAITRIGEAGTGHLAKTVNQICIASLVQGLAEGLHFAKCAGLDPAVVIQAISKGAAQSWQMDNRWKTMVGGEFEFGFAVDWMRKDLAIALNEAERNGAKLEATSLVDRFYAEVQALGGGRWDTSSLIARLEKN